MIVNSTGTLVVAQYMERGADADFRHDCGRLLFRGYLAAGTRLMIRCPKCGRMVVFDCTLLDEVTIVMPQQMLALTPAEKK